MNDHALGFFLKILFCKSSWFNGTEKSVQCLWVFCSLLVLGSEGESAALQRGLQAVLQAGFLTPCLMKALENWCYTSPGTLTRSTLGSLEVAVLCLCVVLWSQEMMLIVPVTEEYWTEQKLSLGGLPGGDTVPFCCCISVSGYAGNVLSATSSCREESSCIPAAILLHWGAGFELFTSMERLSFRAPFFPLIFCQITMFNEKH